MFFLIRKIVIMKYILMLLDIGIAFAFYCGL